MSNETDGDRAIDNSSRGFSFVDIIESMFSAVANGIGSIMTGIIGTEKSSKSRSARVSYRNYQLIRIYPNTQGEVNDLIELKEAEPDDVKFWTQPMHNKYKTLLSHLFIN